MTAAPFGQVLPTLMDPEAWSVGFDVGVVWTQPERMIAGFGRVFHYERMDHAEVLAEVEDFGQAVVMAARNVQTISFHCGLFLRAIAATGILGSEERHRSF